VSDFAGPRRRVDDAERVIAVEHLAANAAADGHRQEAAGIRVLAEIPRSCRYIVQEVHGSAGILGYDTCQIRNLTEWSGERRGVQDALAIFNRPRERQDNRG
jgi:hypothetical protein